MCDWLKRIFAKNVIPSDFEKFLNERFKTMTLFYTKRWAINSNNPYKMDIRDFITNLNSLPVLSSIEDIFKFKITYIYDSFAEHGMPDFWQFPIETYSLRRADCDDSAILRCALARKAGFKNILCAIGLYGNDGHFFNLMLDNGKVYIVENTSNSYSPIEIPDNDLTKTVEKYKICYILSENNVWVVDNSWSFGKLIGD
jgi:hypothetical protein